MMIHGVAVLLKEVVDADHVQVSKAAGHLGFPDGPAAASCCSASVKSDGQTSSFTARGSRRGR
jgi:hypothetical protein